MLVISGVLTIGIGRGTSNLKYHLEGKDCVICLLLGDRFKEN